VDTAASVRELDEREKASHRGHRGHRGGFAVGGQILSATPSRPGRELAPQGKHRTEVTEVTEG
jgi:hypothetical protein